MSKNLLIATLLLSMAAIADGEHQHKFAADVDAFHALLSPLWHAPASPQRTENICRSAESLQAKAQAITSQDATALQKSLAKLRQDCQAGNSQVDAQFSLVHDEFHHLIDAH